MGGAGERAYKVAGGNLRGDGDVHCIYCGEVFLNFYICKTHQIVQLKSGVSCINYTSEELQKRKIAYKARYLMISLT